MVYDIRPRVAAIAPRTILTAPLLPLHDLADFVLVRPVDFLRESLIRPIMPEIGERPNPLRAPEGLDIAFKLLSMSEAL